MEPPSPARLYAAAGGVAMIAIGLAGFFHGSSLGSPGAVEPALGVLDVNGWLNLLYLAMGGLGLRAAGAGPRRFALGAGLVFSALGIWGFALGGGEAILGLLPTGPGNSAVALALGLLGLAAASEAGTQVAGETP